MDKHSRNKNKNNIVNPNQEINEVIGQQLSYLRTTNGITRKKMGSWLNVSQQQVEKYEKGINRVSCHSICILSKKMNTPIQSFFDKTFCTTGDPNESSEKTKVDLFKCFLKIKSKPLQKTLCNIAKIFSAIPPSGT